jgi:hypothetical protein
MESGVTIGRCRPDGLFAMIPVFDKKLRISLPIVPLIGFTDTVIETLGDKIRIKGFRRTRQEANPITELLKRIVTRGSFAMTTHKGKTIIVIGLNLNRTRTHCELTRTLKLTLCGPEHSGKTRKPLVRTPPCPLIMGGHQFGHLFHPF